MDAYRVLLLWQQDGSFIKESGLSPFAMELALGVCRRHLYLQYFIKSLVKKKPSVEVSTILEIGLFQMFFTEVPDHAAVATSVDLAKAANLHEGSARLVNAVLHAEGLHGVIIETFGSGNAPTESWFINAMKEAIGRGIIVLNVTQCKAGAVVMGQYEASCEMERIGIIGGNDITLEAAVTKMMYLLGTYPNDHDHVRHSLQCSLRGEITVNQSRLS